MSLADALDAIPVVASTTERGNRFPAPANDQRVFNKATGCVERWNGSAWIVDQKRAYVSVDAFGGVADDATDNLAAINAAMAAAGTLGLEGIEFSSKGTYRSSAITVTADGMQFKIPKGTTLRFPVLGAAHNGITVSANDFALVGRGKLQGPASGVYVGDERGVSMIGTSSASRKSGLTIDGPEFTAFGAHAIYAQYVDQIKIPDVYVHDCGYAGMMFLSCDHGRVGRQVRVETITPGTTGNMYGISLTHDSTNYSTDPNAGTQQAANPFCADWIVDGAFVNDIDWEGIDCHGGYAIVIINNKVYNTRYGISCPTSSGAAANYAGNRNMIGWNLVDGRRPDGTVSGRENLQAYAINGNGGSTVQEGELEICFNTCISKGLISQTAGGVIQAEYTRGARIYGNILRKWGGVGINLGAFSENANASLNTFQELANAGDTAALCIRHSGTTPKFTAIGNVAAANGGTAARVGVDCTNMTSRPTIGLNDFKACTNSEGNFLTSPLQVNGSDWPCVVTMLAGAAAVDVTSAAGGTEIIILVNVAGAFTLDTITGAKSGQVITIVNIGAGTVTFSRSSSALAGSVVAAIPTKGTLRLVRIGNTNYEIARSLANG